MITTATACKLKEAHKGITPQWGSGNTTWSKWNSGAASSHKSKKKIQALQIYFKTNDNRHTVNSKQC